jgi:hypothetical protein
MQQVCIKLLLQCNSPHLLLRATTAQYAVSTLHLRPMHIPLSFSYAAVEERCAAITAAADEAVAKLLQELKARLIGMPKKVKASRCASQLA